MGSQLGADNLMSAQDVKNAYKFAQSIPRTNKSFAEGTEETLAPISRWETGVGGLK